MLEALRSASPSPNARADRQTASAAKNISRGTEPFSRTIESQRVACCRAAAGSPAANQHTASRYSARSTSSHVPARCQYVRATRAARIINSRRSGSSGAKSRSVAAMLLLLAAKVRTPGSSSVSVSAPTTACCSSFAARPVSETARFAAAMMVTRHRSLAVMPRRSSPELSLRARLAWQRAMDARASLVSGLCCVNAARNANPFASVAGVRPEHGGRARPSPWRHHCLAPRAGPPVGARPLRRRLLRGRPSLAQGSCPACSQFVPQDCSVVAGESGAPQLQHSLSSHQTKVDMDLLRCRKPRTG